MLKIGILNHSLVRRQAAFTQSELQGIGVESEIIIFDSEKADGNALTGPIEAALLQGAIQLTVQAMPNLPTAQAGGLVITALSRRANPAELLAIRPDAVDKTQIFKLKSGAVVHTATTRRKAQLLDIRPDIDIRAIPGNLHRLRAGACDAIFLQAATVQLLQTDLSDLEVLELNPREFVPAPAQGVLAWQTHRDDLPTRRLLKPLHHADVAALTNVERKLLQLLDDEASLAAFVERDAAGNYHAVAAVDLDGRLRRARLSQSTRAGLAEKLAALLREG